MSLCSAPRPCWKASCCWLGVKPPTASWGNMLRNALDYLQDSPLLAFWPGVFILIAVVCFNFFGDGLRDALDPHHVNRKE